MNGLLVIDKAAGPSSHGIVDSVRRLYGLRKVGHAGTLDPPATGVLLVGMGRATRILPFLQTLPKTYRASVRFGVTTSTEDAAGEVLEERPCSFGERELSDVFSSFVGEIEQTPPMVSAVKVAGEPLYRAARRGEEVERPSRKVRVYELDVEEFDPRRYLATIRLQCSTGTYVRTLAADAGERLGCGGHVTMLRRLAVGSFAEAEAVDLEELEQLDERERAAKVLSMREAMRDFPAVVVGDEDSIAVRSGRPLDIEAAPAARPGELTVKAVRGGEQISPHKAGMTAGIPVAVLDSSGRLLAVYRRSRRGLKPAAVLVSGPS